MKQLMKSFAILLACLPLFASAQCIDGNCWDGLGTYVYPSGARYTGHFRDGKIDGQGTLYFSNGNRYDGNWKDHYREGRGKLVFTNGDTYEGEFRRSRINGRGIMRFANGDHYDGQWRNDLQHGKGVYKYSDGDRYEGEFKQGKLHGNGTMFYHDGSRYAGHWKNNKKHGDGTYVKTDGTRISGNWRQGKYQSSASNDTPYVAEADTDVTNGLRDCNKVYCNNERGQYVYGDGSRWEGDFRSGLPEGQGTCYYADGDKYVGGWRNHSPHGEGIMYYKSGRVLGAIWEYGEPVGDLDSPDDVLSQENISVDHDDEVKIWAVVVGVARYAHMPVLKYTDDDAYHIYAFLKSPEGGALPDEQIRILIDEDANRTNIVSAMRQTFLKADANDVVMLYFSGHGLPGSFLPVDFDGYNNRLQHEEVKTIFEESKAKHKLCLADACHSGTLTAMRTPLDGTLKKYYEAFENSRGGTALLLSSKGDEVSLEDQGLRQGIFSHFLIRGLKGEADADGNAIVTIAELYDFVHIKVRKYTANAQSPTITGSYDERMPVAVAR